MVPPQRIRHAHYSQNNKNQAGGKFDLYYYTLRSLQVRSPDQFSGANALAKGVTPELKKSRSDLSKKHVSTSDSPWGIYVRHPTNSPLRIESSLEAEPTGIRCTCAVCYSFTDRRSCNVLLKVCCLLGFAEFGITKNSGEVHLLGHVSKLFGEFAVPQFRHRPYPFRSLQRRFACARLLPERVYALTFRYRFGQQSWLMPVRRFEASSQKATSEGLAPTMYVALKCNCLSFLHDQQTLSFMTHCER